jgi:hypothetical protein
MEVTDEDHKRSLYKDEQILIADPGAHVKMVGKPSFLQMMMGGFIFGSKLPRKVGGTLYLTNKRLLFIREILKDDKEPKNTKERIALRKEREYFQHLSGVLDVFVHHPRFGSDELEVYYQPLNTEHEPFKFRWLVKDPPPEVWVEKVKKITEKAKPPSKDDLAISD